MKVNTQIIAAIKSHYIIHNVWPDRVTIGVAEALELEKLYGSTPSQMTFDMAQYGERTVYVVATHKESEVTCSTNG